MSNKRSIAIDSMRSVFYIILLVATAWCEAATSRLYLDIGGQVVDVVAFKDVQDCVISAFVAVRRSGSDDLAYWIMESETSDCEPRYGSVLYLDSAREFTYRQLSKHEVLVYDSATRMIKSHMGPGGLPCSEKEAFAQIEEFLKGSFHPVEE